MIKKVVSAIIPVALAVMLLSSCNGLKNAGTGSNDGSEPASSISLGEDDARKLTQNVQIRLYYTDNQGKSLKAETRNVPLSEAKKSVSRLATLIIEELVKGPDSRISNVRILPEKLHLNMPVIIENGIATVDFSKELTDSMPVDKNKASLYLYSVVNSLTELKEVQKVTFKIDGNPPAKLQNGIRLDLPMLRNSSIISTKNETSQNIEQNTQQTLQNTQSSENQQSGAQSDSVQTNSAQSQSQQSNTDTQTGIQAEDDNTGSVPAGAEGMVEEEILE